MSSAIIKISDPKLKSLLESKLDGLETLEDVKSLLETTNTKDVIVEQTSDGVIHVKHYLKG